jgi:nucleotide-binding universal stress UspA family protein
MATINLHLPATAEHQSPDKIDSRMQPLVGDQISVKRVLLATDFSDASRAAFRASLHVCHALKARLSILHVSEYPSIRYLESGGRIQNLDDCGHGLQTSLDAMTEKAKRSGIDCISVIGVGATHIKILEFIESKNIDLVVLGTKSIHGFKRLVFGLTAEAVIRNAKCPVLTVGPQASFRLPEAPALRGIVVFATDFHLSTTEALRYAAFFSTVINLPLSCVNVLPRSAEDASRKGVISVLIKDALQHLASSLDLKIPTPICAVTYGSEVSNAVVQYAKQHDARLIVLGVRRASLAASHIPAHIAYRIITEAPCPVLTIAFPRDTQDSYGGIPKGGRIPSSAEPVLLL